MIFTSHFFIAGICEGVGGCNLQRLPKMQPAKVKELSVFVCCILQEELKEERKEKT